MDETVRLPRITESPAREMREQDLGRTVHRTCPVTQDSILDRWAHLIVKVVEADTDLQTMAQWAQYLYMGVGTLREVCRSAGVPGKRSLDLARVLRAVVKLQGHRWVPESVLSCRDPRTLRTLLIRTVCADISGPLTVEEFLAGQAVLSQDGFHLSALRQALARKSGTNSGSYTLDGPHRRDAT